MQKGPPCTGVQFQGFHVHPAIKSIAQYLRFASNDADAPGAGLQMIRQLHHVLLCAACVQMINNMTDMTIHGCVV